MRTKIKTIERFSFAGKGTVSGNIALDLLDAIDLIKEMRGFIDRIGIYQLDTIDQTDRKFFLDRTKDYS